MPVVFLMVDNSCDGILAVTDQRSTKIPKAVLGHISQDGVCLLFVAPSAVSVIA